MGAHHQVVKIGNAPSVSSAVHKAHGAGVATVSSQPHAAPQSVKGYRNTEKYAAAVAAPAAVPGYAPAPYRPAPVYHAAPIVHAAPAYHAPVHAPAYDEPAVYAYNYAVADDYSGSQFNAGENRDGYAATGSSSVALPDGRLQTVNYNVADAYSGYVADVTYSGQAKYAPAPAPYKPAPAYHA